MACEFICDGCGKRAPAEHNRSDWFKPSQWFQRSDDDGIQVACSRPCIEKIAEKSGKTGVVLPI
jgi:hypothetical protein